MQDSKDEHKEQGDHSSWGEERWTSGQETSADVDGFFSNPRVDEEATTVPHDDEARFEEGLPLIQFQTEDEVHPLAGNEPEANPFGGTSDIEDGDSFFSHLGETDDTGSIAEQFKPLERKSTEQVLSAMDHDKSSSRQLLSIMGSVTKGEEAQIPSETVPTPIVDQQPMDASTFSEEKDLAAMWQAALGDDLLNDELDPSSFFGDDGEGFLDDTEQSAIPQEAATSASAAHELPQSALQNLPQTSQSTYQSNSLPGSSAYPQYTTNYSTIPPVQTYNSVQPSFGNQPLVERAQSFADKAKGGYSSPYDAPMDISRPKRGPPARNSQPIARAAPGPPPPPKRNDSLQSNSSLPAPSQHYTPSPTTSHADSVPSYNKPITAAPSTATPIPSGPQIRPNSSGFFEDLPSIPKPRTSSFGRPVQPLTQQTNPPPLPGVPRYQPTQTQPHQQPQLPTPYQSPPPSQSNQQPNQFGLVGPEKVMPFSEPPQTSGPAASAAPSSASSAAGRYSPGPQNQVNPQSQSSVASKYGNPPGAQIPRAPSVPHQYTPHRPSPLARSASVSQQYRPSDQILEHANKTNQQATSTRRPSLRATQSSQTYAPASAAGVPGPNRNATYHHPLEQTQILSPDVRTFDAIAVEPQAPNIEPFADDVGTPNEHQTQTQRPDINGLSKQMPAQHPAQQAVKASSPERIRETPANPEINFIPPEDGREHDPLRRWQGAPILCWGFGGTVVTSFPLRTPRYAAGLRTPLIKCGPGGINVRSMDTITSSDSMASFPGPLRSKTKKKEVLEWLQASILKFEQQYIQEAPVFGNENERKRQEEKILLYKIIAVLVEHDGAFEGNEPAAKAVRNILSPELAFDGPEAQISDQSPASLISLGNVDQEVKSPTGPNTNTIEPLRKHLLNGEREKAVWHAVDRKMWGHAMLIATTLPQTISRQVAQEFVRNEVRSAGKNTESIAALFEIFAGNWEESVDELVPPSARAGLQMMSKSASTSLTTNGLNGLNRWRETLSLILSNRSTEDARALLKLGELLATYGRYEAAHICLIFSKLPGIFGGPDDPSVSVVLLGTDHRQVPFNFAKNIDSILLTEVYEFLNSVLSSNTSPFNLSYLQAFKLYHAEILAEHGRREEAQQYCDVISASLKGTTKMSPYFHPQLFGALEDLSGRLRQSSKDASNSWISRPSMDKVSGSMWNKFTSFVAGEDGDGASTGSVQADSEGPFARINGNTPPTISRGPSPASGYVPYNGGLQQPSVAPAMAIGMAGSRYAPSASGTVYGSRQPERPNPVAQGYGLLPTSTPNAANLQMPPPSQPANVFHATDSERSIPTPPTVSKYSPEVMTQSKYNGAAPRLQETQFSPPSSETGNSRPSTGQGGFPFPPGNLLSPNEPRSHPYQPSPTADRNSPGYGPRSASSYGPRSASLEPRSASYEPMSATSQPRSYMPSPSSESGPTRHPETYKPSAPMYAEYPTQSYAPVMQEVVSQNAIDDGLEAPEEKPISYGYEPHVASEFAPPTSSGYAPPSAGYEQPTDTGYVPPSAGYEPPSYAETADNLSSPKSPRKKKSIMDLSDDEEIFTARAADLKKKEKSSKGREVDDAVRRAAEEDAKRDEAAKSGSGGKWFGGWFGGKKGDAPKQEAKAVQMKFGEESAFHYDKELKKWVNKNAGPDAAGPSAPTPPPPKGPPSRTVSVAPLGAPPGMPRPPGAAPTLPMVGLGGSGPPSNMSSRNASPSLGNLVSPAGTAETAATSAPNSDGSIPAQAPAGPPLAGGLAPPSRPGTGMSGISNVSSIDDLIGVPQARKGGTVKKGKKGRGYVDVMAK